MKKTLIALAALAATGASIAQVTITGNLTAGYQQSITNSYSGSSVSDANKQALAIANVAQALNLTPAQVVAGIAANNQQLIGGYNQAIAGVNALLPARKVTQDGASGLGVDIAEIFITAKEDIGGGQTVEAQIGLDNVSRGASANFGAHDVKLTYTNTSFGRIQYGNTRGAAVFSGLPSAGAPVIDMDGKLFELRSESEYIQYAAPVGPITLVYQHGEAGDGTGLGQGQSGAPAKVGQRSNMLLGLYRDGPIEAFLAYKVYDNGNATSIFGPAGLTKETQWSLQGAYDLGMAKVGFGYAYTRAHVGATVADMLVGVNVPMGALEVGATWGQEIVSGVSGVAQSVFANVNDPTGGFVTKSSMLNADGTATGWSVGAKYNLSKRTHLKVNHAAWTRSGYAQFESAPVDGLAVFGNAAIETQTNVLLSHSF